jgi:hypothetical protein
MGLPLRKWHRSLIGHPLKIASFFSSCYGLLNTSTWPLTPYAAAAAAIITIEKGKGAMSRGRAISHWSAFVNSSALMALQ